MFVFDVFCLLSKCVFPRSEFFVVVVSAVGRIALQRSCHGTHVSWQVVASNLVMILENALGLRVDLLSRQIILGFAGGDHNLLALDGLRVANLVPCLHPEPERRELGTAAVPDDVGAAVVALCHLLLCIHKQNKHMKPFRICTSADPSRSSTS